LVRGAVAEGVREHVEQDPLEQRRVDRDLRDVVGDLDSDLPPFRPQLVRGVSDRVGDADQLSGHTEGACLEPAHVEQVLHQLDQPVQGLVDRLEQLLLVVLVEDDVITAQAGHRRLGRRQRRAQVVTDGRQQRGAHLVDLGERLDGGRLLGEPLLPQGDGGQGRKRLHHPAVLGCQRMTSGDQGEAVVEGNVDVALSRGHARLVPDRGDQPPDRRVATLLVARGAVGEALEQADAHEAEGFPQLVQQRRHRARPPQHAPGEGREGRCLGAGMGGLAGLPGRAVDGGTHGGSHREEDHQSDHVVALGDGELVDWRSEVVVQQPRADHRREHAG